MMTSSTWKLVLALVFLAISTAVHAEQKDLTKRQIAAIKSQIAEVFEYASVGALRNNAGAYFAIS
jgi:predicted membrane-bound mannosyltransferase